jgi:diguanylate cyclase (GGDEF)-like protein
MQDGKPREAHVFMHHAQGHRVPVCVHSIAIYGQDNEILGSVEVFSDDTHRIQMLDRLREIEQAALIDELTGLANRRYFNRAIKASLAAYVRHQTTFGMLIIDVDHFKKFNDTYGHAVGDKVLQLISRTLAQNCRAYDTPVRWGGEEFAIISEKVTAEELYATAERTRKLIAHSLLHHDGQDLSITVSIGCSVVQPGDDVDAILRRADEKLYQSKNGGRNRVTM